eukprot:TRINITY_DN1972_c0_g1_i6.p1 TRINITY_DN1972_c0_g1~~TRINITY_DN1972_c0_g1_i6.p1  ORF type:complete len:512 (+),score=108.88 TRINITY_DN1972_c0_g1_i6:41-1537(+)
MVALVPLLVLLLVCGGHTLPLPHKTRGSSDGDAEPYKTYWYDQTLDHFNFNTQPATYKQRYLVMDTFWKAPSRDMHGDGSVTETCNGPIIFYTGNEGDITLFYNNTNFVTEVLSQEFHALIVFAEHRYYGLSMPFGSQSFKRANLGYFTSEQALADYAELIPYIKGKWGATSCPVISVGGSYGGMLASWMRMKYPSTIDMALAASAPILQFYGTGVSQYAFNEVVTQTYAKADANCPKQVYQGLKTIATYAAKGPIGLSNLTKTFKPCSALAKDASDLIAWVINGLTYQAMVDYPYPADFLEPLPAWPVTKSCQALLAKSGLEGLVDMMAVYFNSSGQAGSCFNMTKYDDTIGDVGWDYQACTEMVMPIGSNGVTDMFLPAPFDLASFTSYCQATWGVTPRPSWVPTYYGYGGRNLSESSYIIFSNGNLDPWSSGGVTTSYGETIVAIIIENGAHHLDLRAPNSADPASVTQARQQEIDLLTKWLKQATAKRIRTYTP